MEPLFDLSGDVAIVTGAGRGIGEGIATTLAEAGAAVVCAARRSEEIERVAAGIRARGGRAIAVTTDVTDGAAVEAVVSAAIDEFGHLDILVNNAGGSPLQSPLVDLDPAEWHATMALNLTAVWVCTNVATRRMRDGGRVVNISSRRRGHGHARQRPLRRGQGSGELAHAHVREGTRPSHPGELHHAGSGADRDHDDGTQAHRRRPRPARTAPAVADGTAGHAGGSRGGDPLLLRAGVELGDGTGVGGRRRNGVKFGLAFASSVGIDGPGALEICRRAEAHGFESVWGGEHVVMPSIIQSPYPYSVDGSVPATHETPIPDPLIWLAFVAAAAPTLRLGTCVLIVPQRNPLVLAKELATLDHLSGGRVELGLGVGWMREEFEALGIPWERRGARNDEYIAAMRALWAGPEVEFHGEFVDFPPVSCLPRPVTGTIPILVGGDTPAALRRAARLADGYFPGETDPARLARLLASLHSALEDHDRDPATIGINAILAPGPGAVDRVEQLAGLGVDRVMIPAFTFAGPDGLDRLDAFAARLGLAA